MQLSILSALIGLTVTIVSGQNHPIEYSAYNYKTPDGNSKETRQDQVIDSKFRQNDFVNRNMPDRNNHHHSVAEKSAKKHCVSSKLSAAEMPPSYNDKSSGFFVDMGLILTDYYGLTTSVSKLQMKAISRTFTAMVSSYAKAQLHQSNDELYNSVIGLLNVLIEHNVNDTYVNPSDWSKYNINHRVFSPMQVNDLLRKRGRLLSLAQQRDNGSDEVIRKEISVRKMQLKIFKAKGPDSMNTILSETVNNRQYRSRFAEYMWNICAQTQDRDTIRQVRNHFAFWLSQGYEDEQSKSELDATYEDSSSSSFFYPEGMKLSVVSVVTTLLGAIAIGLFMSA